MPRRTRTKWEERNEAFFKKKDRENAIEHIRTQLWQTNLVTWTGHRKGTDGVPSSPSEGVVPLYDEIQYFIISDGDESELEESIAKEKFRLAEFSLSEKDMQILGATGQAGWLNSALINYVSETSSCHIHRQLH